MRYLLDTGIWLWSLLEPERLSRNARQIIADLDAEIFVSVATVWEIAIKSSKRKLTLPEPPSVFVPHYMHEQGIRPLVISQQHALAVWSLPSHHGDPFDRLIIAQARFEEMVLIAADRIFEKYPVELIWGGY